MAEFSQAELLHKVLNTAQREGDERVRSIVGRIVGDLFRAIDDLDIRPEEFWAAVGWANKAGAGNEFGLITAGLGLDRLLDIRLDEAERARGMGGGTERAIEGPLYVAGAPLSQGEARLDGDPEQGRVLFMEGRVTDLDGRPLAGAVVDVWHANTRGEYSHFDGGRQRPYNLRRRIVTEADGSYRYRTLIPSGYGVPEGSATDDLLGRLGRHGRRPAHIHYFVSAEGFRTLTTQLNIPGDTYLDDDYAFATRDGLVIGLERHADPAQIAARGLSEPFFTSRFDFALPRA